MEDSVKQQAKAILTAYLEQGKMRKTPERFAILDAVYTIGHHFSLAELGKILEKENFRVSRATLYNTIELFLRLHLVDRHHLLGETIYEATLKRREHSHQVCTVCGEITEIVAPEVMKAIDNMKLRRFRKNGYSLYIYGICSTCQAKITRASKKKKK
ncbi:MAG: transcriptional repressor [Prevotella sp.]|nr:transcriptional repressor [Prevotella sp.]